MAFKILGLHGSSQTGEIFHTRLEPLITKSPPGFTWEFPDGPIELGRREKEDEVSRRAWYDRGELLLCLSLKKADDEDTITSQWGSNDCR